MKFFKKIGVSLLAFVCAIIVMGSFEAMASSASISFGTDKDSIKAGQNFTLTVIVDSSDGTVGNVETRITYDEAMLEVISSDKHIKGDAGLLILSDDDETGEVTKNYEIKFKALQKGSVEFVISDNASVYEYEDGSQMSVSTSGLKLTIGASVDASADSSLSLLDLHEGKLEPEFSPQVFSYKVKVPYETSKLYIDAQATDSKNAKVTVVGNDDLKVGANNVMITVTAEDGSSTDYNLNVIKETQEDTIEPGTIQAVIQDKEFTVYEDGMGNEFIQNGATYQVIDLEDESIIPVGYVKTRLNIFKKISITAYTVQNDLSNDFMLIYCQNVVTKDTGFYQYDRVEKTLQRYTGAIDTSNTIAVSDEENGFSQSQKMTIALVGAVLCSLVIVLLILLVKAYVKIKGLKSDDIY